MRTVVQVGWVLGLAAFAACSSNQTSRFTDSGSGGGNPTSGTNGSMTIMPSTTTINTGGAGGRTATGGAGGGSVVKDPVPDPCMQTADCSDGGAGFVCTVANKCGQILGPCVMQADCMGDSYCCTGPMCRKDGAAEGVCIPGYVPPGNTECKGAPAAIGVFSPAVQCEWPEGVIVGGKPTKQLPPAPYQAHIQVMSTPMVADTPIDSGAAAEIIVVAGNQADGKEVLGTNPAFYGVIQILSGQTCELKATIDDPDNHLRQTTSPALGDLNGDGKIDIVARRNDQGLVAFFWDDATNKYKTGWSVKTDAVHNAAADQIWDPPSIHDLNDDGIPEVIMRTAVYDGRTGTLITNGLIYTPVFNGLIPVLGDLNGDGIVDMLSGVGNEGIAITRWMGTSWSPPVRDGNNGNSPTLILNNFSSHYAYADFGTYAAGAFDPKHLDGKPEIVAVGAEGQVTTPPAANGRVAIYSADEMGVWHSVMDVLTQFELRPDNTMVLGRFEGGGPPTIGDFDGDGFPEVAVAGGTRLRVFDFDCATGGPDCMPGQPFVRWSQPSQDGSSKQTGGSAFDFDGDKQVEVVYADECFLRVYDGRTGVVKYSAFRTSNTWYEGPVIADVNKDQTTKILVNSAEPGPQCSTDNPKGKPYVDPIHRGVACRVAEDCPSTGMACDNAYCRCTTSDQCRDPGLVCTAPPAGTPGTGNTCRAQHPNGSTMTGLNPIQHGIRVLNDKLNRWASSRPMWNQHAYSVTNVNEDGTIPKTSDWIAKQNFKVMGLNNYRQNVQGPTAVDELPDITGRIDRDACQLNGNQATLTVNICNRGKRAVPASVPVTFYDSAGAILCTGITDGPVPTGSGCKPVRCTITGADTIRVIGKKVTIKANDDGHGQRGTVECNYENNGDSIDIMVCPGPA
jgi:hypothetical protein